jgi:hypothetical protein
MRLATRALLAALVSLVLCAAVSAQTVRSDRDPRNQSPAVGTGGPEGGPTGLFTIYEFLLLISQEECDETRT